MVEEDKGSGGESNGAFASEPGSREPSPTVSAASGFDPSRKPIVGERAWFVPSQKRGRAQWVAVAKVGRKWVEFTGAEGGYFNGRAAIGSVFLDGGGYVSPGRLYSSQEEYEDAIQLDGLWRTFANEVNRTYHRPKRLDAAKLRQLIALFRDSGIEARRVETPERGSIACDESPGAASAAIATPSPRRQPNV